jgi:hypothetical protein
MLLGAKKDLLTNIINVIGAEHGSKGGRGSDECILLFSVFLFRFGKNKSIVQKKAVREIFGVFN